jgi:hypothetical protein
MLVRLQIPLSDGEMGLVGADAANHRIPFAGDELQQHTSLLLPSGQPHEKITAYQS